MLLRKMNQACDTVGQAGSRLEACPTVAEFSQALRKSRGAAGASATLADSATRKDSARYG